MHLMKRVHMVLKDKRKKTKKMSFAEMITHLFQEISLKNFLKTLWNSSASEQEKLTIFKDKIACKRL